MNAIPLKIVHDVVLYGLLERPLDQETTPRLYSHPLTGCSLVAKAPALGAGDRRFESGHPDVSMRS